MGTSISKIISVLLHPIFMPLITLKITLYFLPIYNLGAYPHMSFITCVFVLTTIVLPLLSVLYLMSIKKIHSLEMRSLEERPLPLFLSSVIMFGGFILLRPIMSITPILTIEFLCAIIIVFIAGVISKHWKISLHMMGAGGATGAILGLHLLYGGFAKLIILMILTSSFLAVARKTLKAHNSLQIYIGFLVGLFIQTIGILVFL